MVQAVLFATGLVAGVASVSNGPGSGTAGEQRQSIHRLRIKKQRIRNVDRSPDGDG